MIAGAVAPDIAGDVTMLVIPLTLKFLTPAFIGGSENVKKAEFRLPSLKGVLRYWWRQFQDQTDPQALFEKESRIFGSTKGQSRVHLRQVGPNPTLSLGKTAFNESGDGIRYLLYSCYPLSQNQRGRLQWILPGQSGTFELRLTGTRADNQEVLLALYFAQAFGGLGHRSRRGAGSFQLSTKSSLPPNGLLSSFATLLPMKAEDFIHAYTQQDFPELGTWVSAMHSASPLATAFTNPGYFKRISGAKGQTWGHVLDKIGQCMKNFRSVPEYKCRLRNDFDKEACALHQAGACATPSSGVAYSGPNPLSKAAFGLPILYTFKQRDPVTWKVRTYVDQKTKREKVSMERWRIQVSPAAHERRASPLFISVKEDAQGVPYANLLVLWSQFLPFGEHVKLEKVEKKKISGHRPSLGAVNQPTDTALVSFLNQFP